MFFAGAGEDSTKWTGQKSQPSSGVGHTQQESSSQQDKTNILKCCLHTFYFEKLVTTINLVDG